MNPCCNGFTVGFAVSVLLSFVVYVFYHREWRSDTDYELPVLQSVLNGLLEVESRAQVRQDAKVAVGFGSCLDILGNGLEVLSKLGATPPSDPENFNTLQSLNEFEKTFAYFFMHGASAGRFTKNASLFDLVGNIMKDLPDGRSTLGGNAPVMTKRFVREGVSVLLISSISPSLKNELSSDVQVVGGSNNEDTHLILEYQRGDEWGNYTAPRANRFIIYNQGDGQFASLFDDLEQKLIKFAPSVLVVGGLRMILNFKHENGQSGFESLRAVLSTTSQLTRIHVEMSSFPDSRQLQQVIKHAVYFADSLGMNEQELPNLRSNLVDGVSTLVSDSHPRIATTLDHMRAVMRLLRDRAGKESGMRRLTRLHVHTLAYQVIMTARGGLVWENSESAVAKAALTAYRHTCGSEDIKLDNAKLLVDDSFSVGIENGSERKFFNPDKPVTCWSEEEFEICIAPVLVCKTVVQTVGGGDNVSAAGLALQV